MITLLKTEWLKLRKYWAFWLIAGVTALSYPGITFIFHNIFQELSRRSSMANQVMKMLLGNPFTFPEVWHTIGFATSLFVFIPAVVVIMLITNEYTFKTHRQNIIDGWSRSQFLTSKLLDVAIVATLVTVLYVIATLTVGFLNRAEGTGSIWTQSHYIGLFWLQAFAQLSIAFLVAFLVRKAFIALGAFLFYYLILEPIIVGLLKWKAEDIGRYMPLEISDRLIPPPAFVGKFDEAGYKASMAGIQTHVFLTILVTAAVWFLCYRINQKRDL